MRRSHLSAVLFALLAWTFLSAGARAAEPFRYPEKKYGKGELKYRNDLPVLCVEGTPAEIGEQAAILAVAPAIKLQDYPRDVLRAILKHEVSPWLFDTVYDTSWKFFLTNGEAMVKGFPDDHRAELEAMIEAAKLDRARSILGNTMFDSKNILFTFQKPFGCAALLVEPGKSATGGPLFGRGLDFPTAGYLNEYSLVTVYRPRGKHAFVSVGFPGLIGCLSGMNDAGLTVAVLESHTASDDSLKFDPKGLPYAICFRKLLEECTTIEEAEKALRDMRRGTLCNLAICDTRHAAVFEITPKNVVVRPAEDNLCLCTNHFRTKELCCSTKCWRYEILAKCQTMDKIDVAAIGKKLDAVNQGSFTLQTMVFEPAALKLHLAIGKCPTSALPMKELDLGPLLKN